MRNFLRKKRFGNTYTTVGVVVVFIFVNLPFSPLPAYADLADAGGPSAQFALDDQTSYDFGAITWIEEGFINVVTSLLGWVFHNILGVFVGVAGWLFDRGASISLNGATYNTNAGIIPIGWTLFRDLINMLFIFIIIYIGIKTILGIQSSQNRQTIVRLVIFGLLINFSLVITGVIIDASNVLALGFYQAFPDRDCRTVDPADPGFTTAERSLSCPFKGAVELQTFTNPDKFQQFQVSATNGDKAMTNLGIFFFGIIFKTITTFVLAAGGILFLLRTVVLTFLMIVAPIGIAAFILPETTSHGRRWLTTLLHNAFFAPIFLALYYVVARMYTSDFLDNVIGAAEPVPGGADPIPISVSMFFISLFLVSFFMIGTLILSKRLGVAGASFAVRVGGRWGKGAAKKTGGYAGVHTVGRAASAIRDSDRYKQFAATNRLGALAHQPLKSVAGAGFGGGKATKGGYEGAKKRAVERKTEVYKHTGTDKRDRELITERRKRDAEGRVVKDKAGKVVTEQVSAQKAYLEELARQRKVWETAAAWFKRNRDVHAPTPIKIGEKRDKKGKIIKEATTVGIGGKQTRVDRETLLRIHKDGGKSTKEKLVEEIDKDISEAEERGREEGTRSAPPPPPPGTAPAGGGTA